MKLRRLSAAVLVAVIGAGVVLPAAASAASDPKGPLKPFEGKGSIVIEGGFIDPNIPAPDPEIPGKPIDPVTPIVPNPSKGDHGVTYVYPLDFGKIKLGGLNQSPYAAAATPVHVQDDDGNRTGDTTTRGHMIYIQDQRGTLPGYVVTADLTQQFTLNGGTATLDGASIKYTNGIVGSRAGGATFKDVAPTFDLTQDNGAQRVLGADVGQGGGSFTIEYGQSPDYDKDPATNPGVNTGGVVDTADKSVFLTIPAGAFESMQVGTYEAEITWEMTSAYSAPVTP